MDKYHIYLMIVAYLVWWTICTSKVFIISTIRNVILFVVIGTIIKNNFESDLIVFALVAFHPIFIKTVYKIVIYYLMNR